MRAYGNKKVKGTLAGHQRCGICHPSQKSMKARARRDGKELKDKVLASGWVTYEDLLEV